MAKLKANTYRYTKGYEYSLDGENYIGEYHIAGQTVKTGPEPSPYSKPLTKYYSDPNIYEYDKARNFLTRVRTIPNQIVWTPQPSEYRIGYATRYFVGRVGNCLSYPIEIDSQQYSTFGKDDGIDEGVYALATIKWKLTGPERSMMYNGNLIEGIFEHNQKQTIIATTIIANIETAIKSYLEYGKVTMQPDDIANRSLYNYIR